MFKEPCDTNNQKSWFEKHQKILLQYANTEAGKYLLGVKSGFPIIKITPNSYHQLTDFVGKKAIIRAVFYTSNAVAKIFLPILTKMEMAKEYCKSPDYYKAFLHHSGLELNSRKYPQIFLADLYAGAGDGTVRNTGAVYNTVRTAATGETAEDNLTLAFLSNDLNAAVYMVARLFFPTDTSSIDGNVVKTAVLNVYYTGSRDTSTDDTATIIATTQANTSALITADYNQIGAVSGGVSGAYSSWAADAYTQITLNATGIGWIDTTGTTKIGLRATGDLNNTTPTTRSYIYMYMSEQTGTSTDPKLVITYKPRGAFLLNFV